MTRIRARIAPALAALILLPACVPDNQAATAGAERKIVKGGDEKNGAYDAVAGWWKPAPEHTGEWTWGEVSGVAADNPDRIIVSVWGDRSKTGQERPNATNYMVAVDRNGTRIENWSQWDSLFNKAHQVYISPYDPERNVWLAEMGGATGRTVYMSVMKFSNDGKKMLMRLYDPNHPKTRDEARANPHPAPYAYGNPSTLAFFPDGSFILGDGYYNSRIIHYDKDGKYLYEFGELGSGPGQFDLIHGVAVDRDHRIYVADRTNNRIQVFTEDGKFVEQWPSITDPVGVYIDENESVWVISARLNRLLKYSKEGELQYYFGTYGGTNGGFAGGLQRPHEMDVDQDGNLYVTSWDGGYLNKYVPQPGADPSKLVGKKLVLAK